MTHKLSDFRTMRYSFDFGWPQSVFLFIYVIQSMYLINETERLGISHFQSAVAILTFEFPLACLSLSIIFWHEVQYCFCVYSICHCYTVGTFHFFPHVSVFIGNLDSQLQEHACCLILCYIYFLSSVLPRANI